MLEERFLALNLVKIGNLSGIRLVSSGPTVAVSRGREGRSVRGSYPPPLPGRRQEYSTVCTFYSKYVNIFCHQEWNLLRLQRGGSTTSRSPAGQAYPILPVGLHPAPLGHTPTPLPRRQTAWLSRTKSRTWALKSIFDSPIVWYLNRTSDSPMVFLFAGPNIDIQIVWPLKKYALICSLTNRNSTLVEYLSLFF